MRALVQPSGGMVVVLCVRDGIDINSVVVRCS
jgi:hypothetical protein